MPNITHKIQLTAQKAQGEDLKRDSFKLTDFSIVLIDGKEAFTATDRTGRREVLFTEDTQTNLQKNFVDAIEALYKAKLEA